MLVVIYLKYLFIDVCLPLVWNSTWFFSFICYFLNRTLPLYPACHCSSISLIHWIRLKVREFVSIVVKKILINNRNSDFDTNFTKYIALSYCIVGCHMILLKIWNFYLYIMICSLYMLWLSLPWSCQRWKNIRACKQCLCKFFIVWVKSVTNPMLFCC